MIIEGLCTTLSSDGQINLAPMGPVVDESLTSFLFRPFKTSTTFQNLASTGQGVFHVTDDVLLIARGAVGELTELPVMQPAMHVTGNVVANACRWYEFEVTSIDDSQDRTEVQTRILHVGHLRDFFGFNRAKHAILELAISATRLHLLSHAEIRQQLQQTRIIIEKTAGSREHEAFLFLSRFFDDHLSE